MCICICSACHLWFSKEESILKHQKVCVSRATFSKPSKVPLMFNSNMIRGMQKAKPAFRNEVFPKIRHAEDSRVAQNDPLIIYLPKLHPDMPIMGDKGFTTEDLLHPNIDLNAPPRIPTARPNSMTEKEFFLTCYIE